MLGARGRLRFTPTPGRGARRIEADLTLAGLPAEQHVVVARFAAPGAARPGRPGGLHARLRGSTLQVSWRPVGGVAHYAVIVRERGGAAYRVLLGARRHSVTIAGVTAVSAGTVSVRAIGATGRRGPLAIARYRAARRATTRFLPFSQLRRR